MKKSLLLFAVLLTTATAWAQGDPVSLSSDGNGGYYICMPTGWDKQYHLTLDGTITSFKIYDDGGPDGNHSAYNKINFYLIAPEGYTFNITGTVTGDRENNWSWICFYDGSREIGPFGTPSGESVDFTATNQSINLYFYSTGVYAGFDLTVTLVRKPEPLSVNYIDAYGNLQSTIVTPLTGYEGTLSQGWYVVNSNINRTKAYQTSGTVNIILADGCSLNFGTEENPFGGNAITDNATLNIYGQSEQTGQLNIVTHGSAGMKAVVVNNYNHYGGNVNIKATSDNDDAIGIYAYSLNINRGSIEVNTDGFCLIFHDLPLSYIQTGGNVRLTSETSIALNSLTSTGGEIRILGGTFYATGELSGIVANHHTITLGWANRTDHIYASKYYNNIDVSTVKVADGQFFTDGTNIYSGTLTNDEMITINGKTLTPDYSAHFSQDGDVYTIHTAEGWDIFCDMLEGGESFSGKTVKLGNDISVSRMAGKTGSDDSTPFGGTFDGDGKTLTFNYTGSEDFIAPFSWTSWTNSPIFRNLTVSGTINTTGSYAAGLVGHLYGEVTIEHCTSNVDITCASGGSGFVGLCEHTVNFSDCLSSAVIHSKGGNNSGFVGWSRASGYAISFTGCVFNGKLLQIDGEGGINGGFIGWTGSNKTVTITDCLVNTATLADGETMASGSTATFARGWNATTTATNCYYTAALGAPQCTQARSITAGEYVTVANAGTPETVYATSGITAYPTGIKYNDVLYAGNGDSVALTIGFSGDENAFAGYEASAGTLSGSENPYTLTMPDQDVVITANTVAGTVAGDANEDGDVDVNDITTIINYILGKNPSPFNFNNADVNGDSDVNVMDVTAVINMILGVE